MLWYTYRLICRLRLLACLPPLLSLRDSFSLLLLSRPSSHHSSSLLLSALSPLNSFIRKSFRKVPRPCLSPSPPPYSDPWAYTTCRGTSAPPLGRLVRTSCRGCLGGTTSCRCCSRRTISCCCSRRMTRDWTVLIEVDNKLLLSQEEKLQPLLD